MEMTDRPTTTEAPDYIELAANIVSSYVAHNSVPVNEVPALVGQVHAALRAADNPAPPQAAEKPHPAVPVKKSITPDFLISLEDGKQYRSLKRHLAGRGLTPEQYRAKWGLARDYPMVAPNYSAQRSELARSMGLGQKRKGVTRMAAKAAATSSKVSREAPQRRARKKAS
jgi:predicted transcriptional regulator